MWVESWKAALTFLWFSKISSKGEQSHTYYGGGQGSQNEIQITYISLIQFGLLKYAKCQLVYIEIAII